MALPIKWGWFRRHKLRDIRRWARSLEHVRFCHPADYQIRDREIFEVAVAIPGSETEFVAFCERLGMRIHTIQPEDAVARAGVKYTPDEWKKLVFAIPEFPAIAQPKDQTVGDARFHAWVRDGFLELVVAPGVGPTSLDESDYERAKALDQLLSRQDLQYREPPFDHDSCVCPKYYPEYWR